MNTGKSSKWFPHDSDALDDPKIIMLVMQFGMEGFGLYWMLLEYLIKQPGYSLPVAIIEALSRRFQVSKEKLEAIVLKYDLFQVDGDYFFSPSLNRRMQDYDKISEKNRSNALKRWQCDGNATALPPHSDRNAIRRDKKRIDKSREDKKKKEPIDVFSSVKKPDESLYLKWQEWLKYRSEIKKPYKTAQGATAAYSSLLALANQEETVAVLIIQQSIEHEWQGFFPLKNKSPASQEDPITRGIREVKEAEEMIKRQRNGNTE